MPGNPQLDSVAVVGELEKALAQALDALPVELE